MKEKQIKELIKKEVKKHTIIETSITVAIIILIIAGGVYLINNPKIVENLVYKNNDYLEEETESPEYYIEQETMKVLNIMYESYSDEFLVGLEGYTNKTEVVFNNITTTNIIYSTDKSLRHLPIKALAKIHSHPSGTCEFSGTDFYGFGKDRTKGYNLFSCIICDIDTIYCYDGSLDKNKVQIK